MSIISKREKWINKKKRISFKIRKKLRHPRLIVFRSNKNIFLQLIDNTSNNIICSSSSIDKSIVKDVSKAKNKMDMSRIVAEDLANKLKSNKLDTIVFDRNGYRFHGRVKTVADTLRKNGISL
jgi:large subunit ribosomal protein L18